MSEKINIEEVRLQLFEYATAYMTDVERLSTRVRVDWVEHMAGVMRVCMERAVWGQRGDSVTVSYPADWWQHFKQRFFPRWALKRWPVLKVHETYSARVLCPDLKISRRDGTHYATVYSFDGPYTTEDGGTD